jgi:ankyrin repeat protein
VKELLEAIEHDSLVKIKKLLSSNSYNLNQEVIVGAEYDLEEYDEIALPFYLIQNGASLEAIELLIEHGMDITYTNKEGLSALDFAIKYRREDIIKLCKKSGISLTKSSRKSGLTPLMLAASFNDIELMELLIKEGASLEQKDNYGMNAIDYAYKLGQKKAIEFLENLD